jgi:hypothetical protein
MDEWDYKLQQSRSRHLSLIVWNDWVSWALLALMFLGGIVLIGPSVYQSFLLQEERMEVRQQMDIIATLQESLRREASRATELDKHAARLAAQLRNLQNELSRAMEQRRSENELKIEQDLREILLAADINRNVSDKLVRAVKTEGNRLGFPDQSLLNNIVPAAKVLSEYVRRTGDDIEVQSVYRPSDPILEHNRLIAIDFVPSNRSNMEAADVLRAIRADGMFQGAIGMFGNNVHFDTRGQNIDLPR